MFIPIFLTESAIGYICLMLRAKKTLWIEVPLHLLFWAGVFYALTSLNSSHIHVLVKSPDIMWGNQYEKREVSVYIYLTLFFLIVLFYGNVFLVLRKTARYPSNFYKLVICAAWFILIFGTNYLIVGPFFDRANPAPNPPPPPPAKIDIEFVMRVEAAIHKGKAPASVIERVGLVNFNIRDWRHLQPVLLFAFLVILGISFAYFFLKQWARSELMQLSTENKFLRSQINPHFLFNTLNNLFSMAQAKGNDDVADGIAKLSGMMRYMLYDSNEEHVFLSTEITYLQECITLNKLRYADDEVIVKFDHPANANGVRIAPMLFIPFVENAFKHGVVIGQTTTINIAIGISGKLLIFTCENANHAAIRKMDIGQSGIGLENVKRRLELLYPGKHRLALTETEEKFSVHLEVNLV